MKLTSSLVLEHVIPDRPWLEFGVATGETLKELADHAPIVYGFDWFNGLPEDWSYEDQNGHTHIQDPKGKFRCDIPKELPSNAVLVVGLFQSTLPAFLDSSGTLSYRRTKPWRFGLIHIDCDLYSSTKFVLDKLEPFLDDAVIAFDEIRGFLAGEHHEGRAFAEFLDKGTYTAELIGHQHNAGAIYKVRRATDN